MKKIKIGFFTGWRCEYGLTVELLKALDESNNIELFIYPNGLHLLEKFGNTVEEIENDGFTIGKKIYTYSEEGTDKAFELTNSINMIYKELIKSDLDCIIVNGDRIEAYAVALSAHFSSIPIFHIGGGVITKGAVDNIYRYNISNLSNIHFVTNATAYNRLVKFDTINSDDIYFVGSTAVDRINKFKDNPCSINDIFPSIKKGNFALMTFHPVTKSNELIPDIMDKSIKYILDNGYDLLITYPNNDNGSEDILNVIEHWSSNSKIFISKNLGAKAYYSALNDCKFVVGNSSSGIIEAPYFNKIVLNMGSRQDGRDKDYLVKDVDHSTLLGAIQDGMNNNWNGGKCNEIYGNGNSSQKIIKVIKKYFQC